MSTVEEPDLGSVIAVNWSYPNQEIWKHVSPGSWPNAAHPGYASAIREIWNGIRP
ncbi:hypothetical protein [Streptosporangium roseum]|uniref:hypothetical protein n=1 Tax=Streptosporangium roseum TaxID=2001 RepID=UPI00331D28F1